MDYSQTKIEYIKNSIKSVILKQVHQMKFYLETLNIQMLQMKLLLSHI